MKLLTETKDYPYWWEGNLAVMAPDSTNKQGFGKDTSISIKSGSFDVIIIGAGFTGLSAAITMAQAGKSVICIDAECAGYGASTRNGGMVGSGPRSNFDQLKAEYGKDLAINILQESLDAYDYAVDLMEKHNVECDFKRSGRFHAAWSRKDYQTIARSVEQIRKYTNIEVSMLSRDEQQTELATPLYHGGCVYHRHGGLNPFKFHQGLLNVATSLGVKIFSNTVAMNIAKTRVGFHVETNRGVITGGNVLVATNGYTPSSFSYLKQRILPIPSFIAVTERLGLEIMNSLIPNARMIVETRSRHGYYRPTPDGTRLLFGARVALSNISHNKATTTLSQLIAAIFPSLKNVGIEYSWHGWLGFTFSNLPHVGQYDGIHYAMGYCGSGVAMAPYLGHRAAMNILGNEASPSAFGKTKFNTRFYYRGAPWFMPAANVLFSAHDVADNIRAKH